MANPKGRVILEEGEAEQAAKRYVQMEAELEALRQRNEELMRSLQEQQNIVVTERVRADRRSRAQMQEFVNLTVELLAGSPGPQLEFDTWLFQVCGHLELLTIPPQGHIPYAASLLRGKHGTLVERGLRRGMPPSQLG